MPDEAKGAWVLKVLGIRVDDHAAAGSPALKAIQAAGQVYRTTMETVDTQIAALQQALRSENDNELSEIAEFGLNGVTGGFKVKLLAALMGAEAGNADAAKTLAGTIPGFRKHLESDERIDACDENPFNVTITVRATLLPALEQLERAAKL